MATIPWSVAEDSLDVNFSVPQLLRLRCTRNCFTDDWDQVLPLLKTDSAKARVQVWIDRSVVDSNPSVLTDLSRRLAESDNEIDLVAPVALVDGGEQIKNDHDAINAFGKKNWKGTFSVPWAVVNDQSLIANLPDRDFRAGFSEAVKVSLLKSPSAFRYLCDHATAIANRDWNAVMPAIRSSVLMHLYHITHGGDPFEMQEARPLDFGHWSAHKLEHLTNFRLRHGEAVSIGVALDTVYSHLVHGLDRSDVQRTLRVLTDLGLPIFDSELNTQTIFDGLEEFRQHLGGRLTVTMLRAVGHNINVHEIDESAMKQSIEIVREQSLAISK